MKIMVIGAGGREHALAWKLAHSPKVQVVYVAPGNGGTARDKRLQNVPLADADALIAFAKQEGLHFTVVGPEAPLAAGIVDRFRDEGLRIFGPTQAAARLESSKDFAKTFMRRHGIPTARHQTFSDAAQALAYVDREGLPIVIKADGLAAGKGVVVATTREAARDAIDAMLIDNRLGGAGARVVIEEFLDGEEASFIVVCDGRDVVALATSQDHKRLLDGDAGPNTGGMGAYSPAPIVTPALHARVMREIILPTLRGMEQDGMPYSGFLYAGLMIDAQGRPRTLEFNCRMGDPETQPILARLKTDLFEVLDRAINGKLGGLELEWDHRLALGVVLAAEGYPDAPRQGGLITGIPGDAGDHVIFHAGTALQDGALIVNGGRVLCVVGLADTVRAAQRAAYSAIEPIRFDGMQYRHDIGHRAIRR